MKKTSNLTYVIGGIVAAALLLAATQLPLFDSKDGDAPVIAEPGNPDGGDLGLTRIKQLSTAAIIYSVDWDGLLPSQFGNPNDLEMTIYPYLRSRESFFDADGIRFRPNPELEGVNLESISNARDTVMFYSANPVGKGHRVCYADGRGEIVEELSELNFTPELAEEEEAGE